jgi:hypothetical protein
MNSSLFRRVLATTAVAVCLGTQTASAAPGSTPTIGSISINEFNAVNVSGGSADYFELLVTGNGVDLRGLRVSDNELTSAGTLNNGETVFVFGSDSYLENVPQGTLVTVWSSATGVTTDTTVDPAANDFSLTLAPGTGFALGVDGLGGSAGPGLSTTAEALYVYLPGPDGNSAGSDNVYLDFFSADAAALAPAGVPGTTVAAGSDGAYRDSPSASSTSCSPGAPNIVFSALPSVAPSTPGAPNPGQDLSICRATVVEVPVVDKNIGIATLGLAAAAAVAFRVRRRSQQR